MPQVEKPFVQHQTPWCPGDQTHLPAIRSLNCGKAPYIEACGRRNRWLSRESIESLDDDESRWSGGGFM